VITDPWWPRLRTPLVKSLLLAIALVLAGCSSAVPPQGNGYDYAVIVHQRLDAVWAQTGLPDSARPALEPGPTTSQFVAASSFAACMAERGWPDYSSSEIGYSYQDISLVDSDPERLDWYECFAAYPVDSRYTLRSVEEFDFLYDYYQDTLIPCLAEYGQPISAAPSRIEFRTSWKQWSDPLFPFLWNPYYELRQHGAVDTRQLESLCPAQPPNQDFYELPD